MPKTFVFDCQKAIAAAWDHCWKQNLEMRAMGRDFRGNTYYLTASDVEAQVRAFAEDTVQGQPWGTTDRSLMGYMVKIRLPGNLNEMVRSFLLRNPNITGHNYGKGHISGMRFRPAGEPLGEVAEASLAKKAKEKANPKPKPVHFSKNYYRALCQEERMKGKFSYSRPSGRKTSDPTKVTCKRCLKLFAEQPQQAA